MNIIRHDWFFIGLSLFTICLYGCSSIQAQSSLRGGSGIRLIQPSEAVQALSAQDAIFIDVRRTPDFATAHIRGALHIPYVEISMRAHELPSDKLLILYCS